MADFAFIKDQGVWINLDYVVRMEPDADDEESTSVTFADGSTFTVSQTDGKKLARRFRPREKKKKKKKKEGVAQGVEEATEVEE